MPSTLHHCQHKFSHSISNYRSNVYTRAEIARKCMRCIMCRQCCRYSRNNLGFGPLLAFDCDFAVESSRLRFYCNLWLHVRLFFSTKSRICLCKITDLRITDYAERCDQTRCGERKGAIIGIIIGNFKVQLARSAD